jgi:hypothetical protein
MKKSTLALYEWGEYALISIGHNPYNEENTLYRNMTEGQVQSNPSTSPILCADPHVPKYVKDIDRAILQLGRREQACLFGKFARTQEVNEDGQPYTAAQVAAVLGMDKTKFESIVSYAVRAVERMVAL